MTSKFCLLFSYNLQPIHIVPAGAGAVPARCSVIKCITRGEGEAHPITSHNKWYPMCGVICDMVREWVVIMK